LYHAALSAHDIANAEGIQPRLALQATQFAMVYTIVSTLSMLLQVCWEQRIHGVFA